MKRINTVKQYTIFNAKGEKIKEIDQRSRAEKNLEERIERAKKTAEAFGILVLTLKNILR